MERMMIASLQLNSTTTGKQVADLFSSDTRLKYPVLRLFDLSELANVGLDPNELQPGHTVHGRFWAYYVESDKANGHGRPYKDVQYLKPLAATSDTPASATSVDTSALLDELRRIRIHLEAILHYLSNGSSLRAERGNSLRAERGNHTKPRKVQSVPICPTCSTHPCACEELADRAWAGEPPQDPTLRYADGSEVSDNDAEIQAYTAYLTAENKPPSDVATLRQWVACLPSGRRAGDTAKPRNT